jgi:hypothetical protein
VGLKRGEKEEQKTSTQNGQWHTKKGIKSKKESKRRKGSKRSEIERQGRDTAK